MGRIIKLMPDYQCWPLWWSGPYEPGNIDPRTLKLTKNTLVALEEWSKAYDSQLNLKDPANSNFFSNSEKETFVQKGIDLWKQLIKELPEYEIWYFHIGLNKLLKEFPH